MPKLTRLELQGEPQWPNKGIGRIRRKSCASKRRYRDAEQAKDARRHWPGQRAYFCVLCNGYHLTKDDNRPARADAFLVRVKQ